MYGINNFNFCRNGVAFLLVALISFAFGQVPTTNTSVNISPYVPNTTYKVVGNSAVGGLNLSKGVITSSSSVQLKVGGGSVSVVRIDPKATINALPENKPFNARVGLNYAHDSLQKGFKDAFSLPNGIPMKMPKRGWFDALTSLPGAHAQACENGAYDVLCWGKLKKEIVGFNPSQDILSCEADTGHSCYYDSSTFEISYITITSEYLPIPESSWRAPPPCENSSSYAWCRTSPITVKNETPDGRIQFATWEQCYKSTDYNLSSCGPDSERLATNPTVVEKDVLYCTVGVDCSAEAIIVENFIPFTAQDLDAVPLPLESMSDADFAVAQDNTNPFSISVEPIGSFVLGSTSSVDSDGNTTTETSIAEVSINNNNSSSPSLETAITTETLVKDSSGNIISSNSSTTIIKEPPPSQIEGDFLTQEQLEQTWGRKDAEAKRDSESAKVELSAEGDKYDKMTEDLLKLLHVKEVDVNEIKEEYRFTFNASKQCPSPYVMNLDFFGKQISLNFDFSFFCEFVELFGLLVLASAYLTCAYIILGLRKI